MRSITFYHGSPKLSAGENEAGGQKKPVRFRCCQEMVLQEESYHAVSSSAINMPSRQMTTDASTWLDESVLHVHVPESHLHDDLSASLHWHEVKEFNVPIIFSALPLPSLQHTG
ncbi:hypothetical protein BaRGS_00017672 [Batillaria attramentaria]|uniref:Uncharacterized protein n=1 Tax=Batillaria attramentaria TaxID=370345 RepID=A0ABD0KV12_9CAEN